jgi:hypothetical protein
MRIKFIHILLIPCLMLLTACKNRDLSRDEAARQIVENEVFNENFFIRSVLAPRIAISQGQEQGLWIVSNNRSFIVRPKAAKVISRIEPGEGIMIYLTQKPQIDLKVTGMTSNSDDENTKQVDFSWVYKNLPSVIKRFAIRGGGGQAFFQKYDDGWRLKSLFTFTSNDRFDLSEQDKIDIQKDISDTKEHYRGLEGRLMASKTASKIVDQFSVPGLYTNGRRVNQQINITDTDVEFFDNYNIKHKVWFGAITMVQVVDWSNNSYKNATLEISATEPKDARHNEIPLGDMENAKMVYNALSGEIKSWHSRYGDLANEYGLAFPEINGFKMKYQ